MEDMLDVYERPYDPTKPMVCMDEKPYQLLGEAREPLLMRPGSDQKIDSEYVRNGTCSIFVFTEPLGGRRHVSVREHRTATDWAEEIKYLSDVMYPDAEKIVLVIRDPEAGNETLHCCNCNAHSVADFYSSQFKFTNQG